MNKNIVKADQGLIFVFISLIIFSGYGFFTEKISFLIFLISTLGLLVLIFGTYFLFKDIKTVDHKSNISDLIIPPLEVRIEIGEKTNLYSGINKVHTGYAYLSEDILLLKELHNEFEYKIKRSTDIKVIDSMRRSSLFGFYVGSWLIIKISQGDQYIYCCPLNGMRNKQWLVLLSCIINPKLRNYKINQIKEIYLILPIFFVLGLIYFNLDIEGGSVGFFMYVIMGGLIVYGIGFLYKLIFEETIIEKIINQNENFNIETVDIEREDSPIYKPFI